MKRVTIPPCPIKTRLEILELCYELHQEITRKNLTKLIREKFDRIGYKYYQYLWNKNYLQYDYGGLAMLGQKGGYILNNYRAALKPSIKSDTERKKQ